MQKKNCFRIQGNVNKNEKQYFNYMKSHYHILKTDWREKLKEKQKETDKGSDRWATRARP